MRPQRFDKGLDPPNERNGGDRVVPRNVTQDRLEIGAGSW
jgi:hypothetical protein